MDTTKFEGHTPEPWAVVLQSDGSAMIVHEYETGKQMNPRGLRLIAHCLARGNSLQTDDANVRLIADAPSLLATLHRERELRAELVGALTLARTYVIDEYMALQDPKEEVPILLDVRKIDAALTKAREAV